MSPKTTWFARCTAAVVLAGVAFVAVLMCFELSQRAVEDVARSQLGVLVAMIGAEGVERLVMRTWRIAFVAAGIGVVAWTLALRLWPRDLPWDLDAASRIKDERDELRDILGKLIYASDEERAAMLQEMKDRNDASMNDHFRQIEGSRQGRRKRLGDDWHPV